MLMKEPENALEFLEGLRKKNGRTIQTYRDIYEYLGHKARNNNIPLSNQFELTPLCNFSCKMCYVHLNPDQMNGQKIHPFSTRKNLMNRAWEAGMLLETLSGGECLTDRRRMPDLS